MGTYVVWLLLAVGQTGSHGFSSQVVEKFPNEAECIKVARAIYTAGSESEHRRPVLRCVEAKIASR